MRKLIIYIAAIAGVALFSSNAAFAAAIEKSVTGMEVSDETIKSGKDLFSANCASCHQIDGKLVGPALKDIHKKRDHEWLVKWIRNNEELRASGDADAIAIYEEYGGAAMNIFPNLSDDQINSIIMYIEDASNAKPAGPAGGEVAGGGAVAEQDPSLFGKVNWAIVILFILIGGIVVMVIRILDIAGTITKKEIINWNTINAALMLIFLVVGMVVAIWETSVHGKLLLPKSASEHGVIIDEMMNITLLLTSIVFFVTQILLFYFAFKYRSKPGRKALFYPVNDKLELAWTIIPAIALTVLVFGGLKSWQKITKDANGEHTEIEVFAYQFGWSARYPGADGTLGNANYNLISGTNSMGLAVQSHAKDLIVELQEGIAKNKKKIEELPMELGKLKSTLGGLVDEARETHLKKIKEIECGDAEEDLLLDIRRKETQISRIQRSFDPEVIKNVYDATAEDDIVVKEIHLPLNEPVTFKFRGRDVIHSAYLPYFRTQMNVVPGLPTQFTFTPTVTTAEMREIKGEPEFDYHIVCNKICGNAHFNMKMKVVIESREDYEKWLREQPTFVSNVDETAEGNTAMALVEEEEVVSEEVIVNN